MLFQKERFDKVNKINPDSEKACKITWHAKYTITKALWALIKKTDMEMIWQRYGKDMAQISSITQLTYTDVRRLAIAKFKIHFLRN